MKNAKRNLFVFTVLLLLGNTVFAQFGPPGGGGRDGGNRIEDIRRPKAATQQDILANNGPKGNSKISGVVLNEDGNSAVEFANVALYNASTKKPVDGAMANEKGEFSLKKVAEGLYYLQVSFIGYETWKTLEFKVEKSKDNIMGVIKLKTASKQLDELVVTGQGSLIEEKVDRLVYNAEKDLNARGGDASDVLKNVPMLSVDLEGNVSLRGSSNLRVLINNKPSTIVASSIADALKMIPADIIKTVEVITSPSAKYDAEGSGGIINIITKKSNLQGLNLNIDTGVGLRGSNLGLNGNYRQGKVGLSLGGHGRAFYNPSSGVTEQNLISSGIKINQTQDGRHFGMFGRYNLGMDVDLAKNQSLSASLAYGTRGFNRTQNLLSETFKDGQKIKSDLRDVNIIDNSHNIDLNLDYLRTFKPGQEWSISSQYSNNVLTNNFDSDFLGENNEITRRQKNINNNTNTEITIQTDYVQPIGKTKQFETGIKAVNRTVNSDFEYKTANPSGLFATDAFNPQGFLNYDQNVLAAYGAFQFSTKKKLNFKTGLRYEHTTIGGQDQKSEILIPAYDNLVPSLNISKTRKGSTYKLGFNRRIQRPGLQQLNPNVNLANPLNISFGNPNLKPELTNNVELSISRSIKKSYLTMAVYGRQTNNAITRISTPSATIVGGIENTFENIGSEKTLGTNIFGNVFFNSMWTLNGGIDLMYKYLEGRQVNLDNKSELVNNDGFVVGGRVQSNLKLKKGWALQLSGGMRGRQVMLQGTQGGMGMYSFGFRKDKGKKYNFGLSADNFFGGVKMISTLKTPTLVQKSTNYMYNSNVRFTFSYKIGNMKFVEQKKTKKVKNDDVKESGDN